jgi:hypothetical protein
VDVHADGDERFQDFRGWQHVEDPLLLRPPCKGRMLDALLDWNVNVLMQWNEPVSAVRFLKERTLNGHGASWQQRSHRVTLA